jgi:hypothetical protein
MNTYKVTGTRKGDKTAKVVTFHETRSKADWWIVEHYAEENGAHAYQVLIGRDTDEGTYWGDAYYIVDGRVSTESEWLKAVKG